LGISQFTLEDLVKAKKVEEALRESQRRYQALAEAVDDCVWETDPEGRITFCSPQAQKLYGYLQSELLGKKIFDFIPQADGAKAFETFSLHNQSKQPLRAFESRVHNSKKQEIYTETNVFPFFNVHGKLLGYRGITRDITERKKADQALMESEERFSKVFHNSPIAMLVLRQSDKVIVEVNDAFLDLTHYSRSELIEHAIFDLNRLLADSEPNEVHKRASTLIQAHGRILNDEVTLRTKEGELRQITYDSVAFKIEGQNYSLTSIRDITTERTAIEALRASEDKYRLIVETTNEGVWVANPDGKTTFVNQKMADMLGYSKEEMLGHVGLEFLDKPHATQVIKYRNVLNNSKPIQIECKFIKKDGSYLWTIANTTPFLDSESKHIANIAMHTDITERKKAEEKLEEYSKNLEKMVEERTKQLKDSERLAAIGATAGMVGHDIRNPLQAIVSELFLAKQELGIIPDSINNGNTKKMMLESLNSIEDNIFYINKIVADLQDYSRTLIPKKTVIDLNLLFEKAFDHKYISEGYEAEYRLENGAQTVYADLDFLKRILNNLGLNAMQSMPNGGKVFVRVSQNQTHTIIAVEDNGEGIPEEVKDRLFTPMFTTKSKGQGLGLAVVKRLVEAQGGTVGFESQVGKGTKFVVELPLYQSPSL
jgi:PAS domain S-box-containing protein